MIKIMNKVKRQHYVPQFYLSNFTEDGEYIHVYDKLNNKYYTTNISNLANEKCFYDINWHGDLSNLNPQLVEKEFSRIECEFSRSINEIIKEVERGREFSSIDLNVLANFLVLQWLRTRSFRNGYIKNWKELLKEELEKELREQGIDLSKYEYEINIIGELQKVMHTYAMFDINFLFRVLNLI